MPGFPIRTSPDQRLVGSSPRLIAASYVLHRLLAPRHPPCALCNLATSKDARARYVVLKVPGPSARPRLYRTCRPVRGWGRASWRGARGSSCGDAPSKLNSVCGRDRPLPPFPTPRGGGTRRAGERPDRIASDRDPGATRPVSGSWLLATPLRGPQKALLRKEVIQPHLPVRLPCYDFVPIADPTFDSSLPKGWATGFGCYRLS